jgi:hypothetical protein
VEVDVLAPIKGEPVERVFAVGVKIFIKIQLVPLHHSSQAEAVLK